MKYNKTLGQEVHFKKRLKTFKPLGSANGDGAGEGKNSRQRRNLQVRKLRVSGKILKSGPLRVHFQLSRAQTSHLFGDSTRICYLNWGNLVRKLGGEFTRRGNERGKSSHVPHHVLRGACLLAIRIQSPPPPRPTSKETGVLISHPSINGNIRSRETYYNLG